MSGQTDTVESDTSRTRVGHCKADDIDTYAGRGQNGRHLLSVAAPGIRGWLGNPYTADEYGREEAIEKFREAFEDKLERDDQFREVVRRLSGDVLGCWCQRLDEDEPACHAEVIAEHADRLDRARADGGTETDDTEQTHVALFSGGHDSAVATHAAMRWGPCQVVMYLDTGGPNARRNQDYVREFCREYGWHLIQWQTPEDYEEIVKKYGFPGPSKHDWFYRYLKERQISKFATLGDELHFWTGVHRAESEARMQRVVERDEDNSGRWYWHAPLADWQPEDFDRYAERFNLPENPLWSTLGRSGDCWCGAFADRMELIDAEAAGCQDIVDYLRGVEEQLDADRHGFDDERREEWAWHDDDPSAWAIDEIDAGNQMMLCSSCGDLPAVADGGGFDRTAPDIEQSGGGADAE